MDVKQRNYRVLLPLISKSFGGAEVRVITQAQALQPLTANCTIVTLAGSMLHQRLSQSDIPFVAVSSRRSSPTMLTELAQIMRSGSYDIVDAHNVQSILWGMWAARLAGVSGRVITIHSDFAAEYPGLKGKLYASVLNLTNSIVKQTINVTDVLQQQAIARGVGSRATLIPNAVPVPPTHLQHRHQTLATEWGFSETDFIIGIVGRLVPVKGHRYLLDAIATLKDLPQVKLVVVGTGSLEAELKAQVAHLAIENRVTFTGFRDDIPDVMQNIDALCMASLSEALPYVILEAASYARPLIVTQVGGLKTLLTPEENALMVPAENPQALAAAIRRLVTTPTLPTTLGQRAYQLVQSQFSVERMAAQVLQVYDAAVQV